MGKFFKLLFKIIAGLVVLLLVIIGSAIYSMRANTPETLYVPAMATQAQTASSAASYLIFGGRTNTGLEVVKILRARGERVTAVIRPASMTPEKTDHLKELGVELIAGDATNPEDVNTIVAAGEYIAIVSTIGCFSCTPPADFIGNKVITDAAVAAGVKRVLQVSSIGAGDSYDTAPFLSTKALAKILPLKTQAEDYLKASGLDYTIIRPGGLKYGTGNGHGFLSEDVAAFGFIDRPDLARLIVGALDNEDTVGKTYHAADETRQFIFQ